ncbi:MAG TPA: tetratricopeptide repeat protein [Nevskiaceae bacterium]|nr:tetratricopeptide repeat protein [Nevskiaceae bacterium]
MTPVFRKLGITLSAAALVACAGTGGSKKDAPPPGSRGFGTPAPPIREITKQKAPDPSELPIIQSEQIAPDADKALENYKKLLELAPDAETRAEAQRRMADLHVQVDDLKGGTEESAAQLKQSIALYQGLLKERPGDPKNDRVLYQLARAQQNTGDSEAAIATLKKLTSEYPSSPLAGDGHFRRADLLYRLDRYPEAESEYATVMGYEERTPFYEPAQYMMGWSQYRQSKFDAAIKTFFDILDRELPDPVGFDVEEALEGVEKGKTDLARDSLRVVSLSFAALGGGMAVSERFQKSGDPRFYPLVYNALGKMLLEKQRYNDAADAFAAFPQRYPNHALAPTFQTAVIGAYREGGFADLVIREKERYASTYDPAAQYWQGRPPTEEVKTALRQHLEDLARHNHNLAQNDKTGASKDKYLVAGKYYHRLIEVYPQDKDLPEINFLLGDALLEGGKTLDAAQEYTETAYKYPAHKRSGEAAYAAFLAYEKNAKEVPPAQRNEALRQAVDSGIKLADTYTQHSSKLPVLTQAAQDLYEMKSLEEAITVAARVLNSPTPANEELRRNAWSVTGDSQFALKHYPEAEKAFSEELRLTPANAPHRTDVVEQLAASIYKQGEEARAAGDQRKAVNDFLRVGQVTPESKIRANADYDAASGLIELKDWPAAETVLESFRGRYPTHQLSADVDKKLALAYSSDNKPAQAAAAFERIAARPGESPAVRAEAAWQAPKLYDAAKMPVEAARSYQSYVQAFPRPLDKAMEARARLVEIAKSRNDVPLQLYWHKEIVTADAMAGAERTDTTRSMAANSALEIGRFAAADAKRLRLSAPLDKSLPAKKQAMETAISALNQAASYNYAESTTAATFELGALYEDFGQSIMNSDRPAKLKDLELEQYNLLLEEQAFPFEEKAIQAHEANIKKIAQGRYDNWVKQSHLALMKMAPGKYAKKEQSENVYESLN